MTFYLAFDLTGQIRGQMTGSSASRSAADRGEYKQLRRGETILLTLLLERETDSISVASFQETLFGSYNFLFSFPLVFPSTLDMISSCRAINTVQQSLAS